MGESAPDVIYYSEVKGNAEHKLSTESEFSPNDQQLRTKSGKHCFIKQYLKPVMFVGCAVLEVVPEKEGKADVAKLVLAKGLL